MYIIKIFDQYFLKDDGEYVIETYSPIVATGFETKAEAEEYVTKNTEWKPYADIVERTKKMVDDFNEWSVLMQRRKIEKIDRTGKYDFDPAKHGRDGVFDFWLNHQEQPNIPIESYRTWPELSEYFKNLYGVRRVSDNGYYIECWFKPGDDYHTFEKEMTYLFDHIPCREIIIKVFDRFLCEGGDSVKITVNRQLTDIKVSGRYVSTTTYRTLKDCFDYLVKERYYE